MRRLRLALALLFMPTVAMAGDWSGSVSVEYRQFFQDPADPRQHDRYLSLALAPEYRHDWGDQRLVFAPFLRLDSQDDRRSHADLREFYWHRRWAQVDLRVGLRRVFWGVTESQHLVDIINQTDLVEDIDGEQKLGQPMVNLAWVREFGTLEVFLLPYFRERRFAGEEGRPRTPLPVAEHGAVYESSRERRHLDWALRYVHSIGDWDIGLAHFQGTGREPRLVPGIRRGELVLIPHYDQIRQTSLDLQFTREAWLWKLELLSRHQQGRRHTAAAGGFEYTFYGVLGSDADVGLIVEYLFDDRGRDVAAFQDDVFLGLRLALNDVQGTDLLIGVIQDRHDGGRMINLEASRRLGQSWRLGLRARAFKAGASSSPLHGLRRDDYVEVSAGYYF